MEVFRRCLRGTKWEIEGDREHPIEILANARSFVELSQGNDTVQEIVLSFFQDSYRDYNTLRVLGEVVGNLEALQRLTIDQWYGRCYEGYGDDDDLEVTESPYWQAFAGVLGRVRHPIELRLKGESYDELDLQNFAVAIQGLSTIRTFHSEKDAVQWWFANTLISALASLPLLENVTLGSFSYGDRPSACEFPGLMHLLESSSLRSIEFSKINFTCGLSGALLDAFEEGSFVTDLRFTDCGCVRAGETGWEEDDAEIATLCAVVQALQRDSSMKCLSLVGNDFNGLICHGLCDGITTALLVNTTLGGTNFTSAVTRGWQVVATFVCCRANQYSA
jgi:hypothetical protein